MAAVYWGLAVLVLFGGLAAQAWRIRIRRAHEQAEVRRRAIELIRYLRQLFELLQKHRGLCFGYMSGEDGLQARLWTTYQQIEDLLAQSGHYEASLYWFPGWHGVREGWARIRERDERHSAEAEVVLLEHNQLIGHLLDTVRDLAHQHDLVRLGGLAAQHRGFWLELLEHAELLGQARALGTGIAARRQNTQTQREELRALRQRIADRAYLTLAALHADPTLRRVLSQRIGEAEDSLDFLLGLIDRLVAGTGLAPVRSAAYFQAATVTIAGHLGLADTLLDQLQSHG
jgi:hypothetical protein